MIARELLNNKLFPLKPTDKCGNALDLLNEYSISFLPVVEGDKHLGYISAADICDPDIFDETILRFINASVVSKVYENQHLFEVIRTFSEIPSSTVSVVDMNDRFIGIISAKDLINKIASLNAFSQPGSIITLQMDYRNYQPSEISRIIESNNARILSLYIHTAEESSNLIEIDIKLNTSDLKSIIATFERYNYNIVASYFREDNFDDFKNRYDLLMKYLDI